MKPTKSPRSSKTPQPAHDPAPKSAPQPACFIWASQHSTAVALTTLAILVLALFRGTLWQSTQILGLPMTDMAAQFVAWRKFGFDELANGNLALWNPYIYGGLPFFGGMQSALLYPPNILFLTLPLIPALNWSIALNMWLLGAFMFAWARLRGLSATASFFAGAILMFCGAYAPHILAGHLPNLCTMAWAPLILLAIDGWLDRHQFKWLLIGMAAVAMQILAGHVQYVFFIAIAAGFYSLLRLIQSPKKISAAIGLLTIYPAGALLSAVQLLTAVEASSESVRSGAVSWDFISMFSFPPENLLLLLAPRFFGRYDSYWSQCYIWEMELFIGITALAMAVLGIIRSDRKKWWPLCAAAAAMFVLALGRHTPLLYILFKTVPGFDLFRGFSKFTFPATVFVAMLSAIGFDALERKASPRALAIAIALLSVILFAAAEWTGTQTPRGWANFISSEIQKTEFRPLRPDLVQTLEYIEQTRRMATISLIIAAATCAGLAALLIAREKWRTAYWGILGLGIIELFGFANLNAPTFTMNDLQLDSIKKVIDPKIGDDRVLMTTPANNAMILGLYNIWGNDPYVLRRYAEYVTWANGQDPNGANQYLNFERDVPGNSLLRLRYFLLPEGDAWAVNQSQYPSVPHVLLAGQWRMAHSRDEIFSALASTEFNPRAEVILEKDPGIGASADRPVGAGDARILEQGTDSLTIDANATRPAVLVISDPYAKGWRARALEGSSQSYNLIPANYWMRAVPLKPGHHKLIIEYKPRSFAIGVWLSAIALILYTGAWGCLSRSRRN